MVVSRKVATSATHLAAAGATMMLPDPRLDPTVDGGHFFEEPAASLGLFHHGLFSRILSISARV